MRRCGVEPHEKNAVLNRDVGVNLTYTWPEESGKLDSIWDEITIDFLNFLDQWIEKKPSIGGVAIRYELWRSTMMIGMTDGRSKLSLWGSFVEI
jgi:hypothetical protein